MNASTTSEVQIVMARAMNDRALTERDHDLAYLALADELNNPDDTGVADATHPGVYSYTAHYDILERSLGLVLTEQDAGVREDARGFAIVVLDMDYQDDALHSLSAIIKEITGDLAYHFTEKSLALLGVYVFIVNAF